MRVEGECWLWTASTSQGYGRFTTCRDGRKTWHQAHRWAFEQYVGPIPEGFEVDHVRALGCVGWLCVRPDHLEAVSKAENLRRRGRNNFGAHNRAKEECPKGHPYSGENLYITKRGHRVCRICQREAVNRWAARDRELNGSRWKRRRTRFGR